MANGSFEAGESGPTGWRLHRGGDWATGAAHTGARYVSGRSTTERLVCESESVRLRLGADYRLAGWVRCLSGEARLGIDLLDERGRVISRVASPPVRASQSWRYVAVETNIAAVAFARAWFRIRGRADLDDVGLASVATAFMGNTGLEADDRGRIPFWGEEKDDTLLPSRRAGEFRPDAEVKRAGKSSALVAASGDWFAVASVNYPLAAWTERCELSAWARCEGSATAQLLACWVDDQQKLVRVDAGAPVNGADWQRLVLALAAPTNAMSVRLVAAARGGRVRFDDCTLLRLAPRRPRVRVFVNQIGYEQAGPKSAVVAANFLPRDRSAVTFKLRTPIGKVVWKKDVPCSGRVYGGTDDDWGWYFWRADFSAWRGAGQFRASAQVGEASGESVLFFVGRGVLLRETAQSAVDFFFIQRCGFEVPGWHKPCHLDDAKAPDGSHLDVTGGWHSAGDYNKLMYEHGDGGVVFALLKALQVAPECFGRYDRDGDGISDALDEAIWGARFVAKMQIAETGALRNHVSQGPGRNWTKWSAPEVHTDNVVGTADDPVIQPGEGSSPLVSGAWARLSVLLNQRGQTNGYWEAALRLWNYSTQGGTNVGSPHLLLSALEFHAVTAQPAYLDYARRSAESLLVQQAQTGRTRGAFGGFGEMTAGALASFALARPEDPLCPKIAQALKDYIAFCVRQADNPFGLSAQPEGESDRFIPADMGNSFQILGRAWAAALVYRVTREPRALSFATDHVDWLLGKNPLDLCLFEGKGAFNPPRYHHRYNQIPGRERGAVPGTVPNGFVREMGLADRPGFDLSRGGNRSPSYRTSEPWLVHNLF
ncbi:MAG: glycoside hydrolase family 9 protein, partial [Verrucomicrobia bacterium]|nr:glycoside hydrolase family 9 protein [Verrucomicrobiota bacterium]